MRAKTNLASILPLDSDTNYKDGNDGNNGVEDITINVAIDGFMVSFMYEDGSMERHVLDNMDDVIQMIKDKF